MPTVSVKKKNENNEIISLNESPLKLKAQSTLFDELDEQGIQLPHGCLSGSCGSCKVQIIEGQEFLLPPGAIEQDTLEHIKESYKEKNGADSTHGLHLRLSCRAKVKDEGHIVICPFK